MSAIRVDILLPRFYNADKSGKRKKVESDKIIETLDEIEKKFGGYTLNDIPISGSWIDPKTKESIKDNHRSIWVSSQNTSKSKDEFKQFKELWKTRFDQKDITMYYITINLF